MSLVYQWISSFPDAERNAVLEAFESASLARIRRSIGIVRGLEQRGPRFRVELLSTYNLEPIRPALQLALDCLPSCAELEIAPLDAIEAYVSGNFADKTREVPNARLVIWRFEEVLPEALYPFSHGFPDHVAQCADRFLERVDRLISSHKRNAPSVPLFVSTLPLPVNLSSRTFASQGPVSAFALIARINRKIYELTEQGVHVLDIAAWAAFEGRRHTDAMLDLMARQPFSAKGQVSFALFVARSLRPLVIPRRKVLAVDLDNMLWGGVVGEDGITGLKLGQDFPGNVHLRIQRELLELRNRGILLVLVSKNNEPDAFQAFKSLPEMLLKWDDFAVRKVNWKHKHENLRGVSRELGLNLDSFALIDDSDYEREQISQFLPEVLILNESSDPLSTLRSLWETDAFDALALTEEDRKRHSDYKFHAARSVEAHQDDLEAFLLSLQIEATIEDIAPSNLDRAVTLLGRTNQFNLTTQRHSRAQLQTMLQVPGSIGLALRLRDKFGDQGIVGLIIANPTTDKGALALDSFAVSCRALGRGIEEVLWAAMLQRACERGAVKLEAEYRPSGKNAIAANLYDRLGLTRVEHTASFTRYELRPTDPHPFPDWITVRDKTHE